MHDGGVAQEASSYLQWIDTHFTQLRSVADDSSLRQAKDV
jgi:hypothetical protein